MQQDRICKAALTHFLDFKKVRIICLLQALFMIRTVNLTQIAFHPRNNRLLTLQDRRVSILIKSITFCVKNSPLSL
jgi:hypothetical protein